MFKLAINRDCFNLQTNTDYPLLCVIRYLYIFKLSNTLSYQPKLLHDPITIKPNRFNHYMRYMTSRARIFRIKFSTRTDIDALTDGNFHLVKIYTYPFRVKIHVQF